MFESLIPIVTQINPKVLIVLALIVVVLFVVSLLKKAIKLGICLLIVCILLCGGVPTIAKLKENYAISYDKAEEVLMIKLKGSTFTLPLKELRTANKYSIQMTKGANSTKISVSYQKDINSLLESGSITLPNFMADVVMKYLREKGIQYTLFEEDEVLA